MTCTSEGSLTEVALILMVVESLLEGGRLGLDLLQGVKYISLTSVYRLAHDLIVCLVVLVSLLIKDHSQRLSKLAKFHLPCHASFHWS